MINNKKYEFTLPMGTKLKGAKTYHIEEVLGQGGYGITSIICLLLVDRHRLISIYGTCNAAVRTVAARQLC